MHQLPKLRIVLNLRIHINDVGPVPKLHIPLPDDSLDMIDWKPMTEDVASRDEDHIALPQLLKVFSGLQRMHIQKSAVIPRTLRGCSLPVSLNLDIVEPSPVVSRDAVHDRRTSLHILIVLLDLLLYQLKLLLLQNYPQDKFRTALVLQDIPHEKIVHDRESLQRPLPKLLLRENCFPILSLFHSHPSSLLI